MSQLPDDQIDRIAALGWEASRQAFSYPDTIKEYRYLDDEMKVRPRAFARAVGEALLNEEVPQWRADCELTHREHAIAIADLQWGIELLQQHLRKGCKLTYQDNQWWLFASDGEGILGAVNVLGLVQQLAKTERKIS